MPSLLRFASRELHQEDRGASAIEYSLIAGIVALGLVGSLAATRTSLSGVLTRTTTSMASGGVASAGPQQGSPFDFAAKTLSNRTTVAGSGPNGIQTYSYTFSDGSTLSYSPAYVSSSDGKQYEIAFIKDPAVNGGATYNYVHALDGSMPDTIYMTGVSDRSTLSYASSTTYLGSDGSAAVTTGRRSMEDDTWIGTPTVSAGQASGWNFVTDMVGYARSLW